MQESSFTPTFKTVFRGERVVIIRGKCKNLIENTLFQLWNRYGYHPAAWPNVLNLDSFGFVLILLRREPLRCGKVLFCHDFFLLTYFWTHYWLYQRRVYIRHSHIKKHPSRKKSRTGMLYEFTYIISAGKHVTAWYYRIESLRHGLILILTEPGIRLMPGSSFYWFIASRVNGWHGWTVFEPML